MSELSVLARVPRARRLFNAKDDRVLNVAVDHGVFNQDRFLAGIEDMSAVIRMLCAAQPDAIQLTIGQARLIPKLPGVPTPALVVRTDVANVYGTSAPSHPFCDLQQPVEGIVQAALQLDAAAVICNLFLLPDNAPGGGRVHQQCVQNVTALRAACTKYGMPLIVETLAFKYDASRTKFEMDNDINVTRPLSRLGCELGADIIKMDPPTNDIEAFRSVVKVCTPCPVLLRGGEKGEESAVLASAKAMMDAGAAGLVYGRNIIHHADPPGITKKFMDVIHP